jgi:hypothetical protein
LTQKRGEAVLGGQPRAGKQRAGGDFHPQLFFDLAP